MKKLMRFCALAVLLSLPAIPQACRNIEITCSQCGTWLWPVGPPGILNQNVTSILSVSCTAGNLCYWPQPDIWMYSVTVQALDCDYNQVELYSYLCCHQFA